jgi:hypothetical protein
MLAGFWWDAADGKPLTFADAAEAWLLAVVRAVLGRARSRGWLEADPSGTVVAPGNPLLGPSVAAEHSPAVDELQKVGLPGGRSSSAISKRAPSSVRPRRSKIVLSGLAIPAHNEARSWTSAQAAAATRPLGAHDCFVARPSEYPERENDGRRRGRKTAAVGRNVATDSGLLPVMRC